ncbi:MAG: hypothetical protein GC162_09265 [Planctomycetes bacterium]|nr:hypothetical protein [Planctomycetota bacterium]
MTPTARNPTPEPIADLAMRYLDGLMSAAEAAQLESRLSEDGGARRAFAAFVHAAGLVDETFRSEAFAETRRSRQQIKPAQRAAQFMDQVHRRRRRWAIGLSAAAMIALAAGLINYFASTHATDAPIEMTGPKVAVLMQTNGVTWGTAPIMDGQSCDTRWVELKQGSTTFEMYSGVSLTMTGPTRFRFVDGMHLELERGRVSATMTRGTSGFAISTPTMEIVDLGTAFDVSVDRSGRTELGVRSGRVMATMRPPFTGKVVELGVAEGLRFDPMTGRMELVNVGSGTPTTADAHRPQFNVSYVNAVLSDVPRSYWRFASATDGRVANEVADGPAMALEGGLKIEAPHGVASARFKGVETEDFAMADGPLPKFGPHAYSIELWLHCEAINYGELVSLLYAAEPGSLGNRNGVQVEMQSDGAVRYMHRNPPGPGGGTSLFSDTPCDEGIWHHLVLVKDASTMSIYLDGRLVGAEAESTGVVPDPTMQLGRLGNANDSPEHQRYWKGSMAQVAVYDHALSMGDIRKHYRAALPALAHESLEP